MTPPDENGTGSGLYRIVTGKAFSVVVLVLWALLSCLAGVLWTDMQKAKIDIATLQEQRIADVGARETLAADIREMKADIKELLREARR